MSRFNKIAIVGVGLIGGSLGLALRRKYAGARVSGIDNADVLDVASKMGAINEAYEKDQMETGVSEADLVFLCPPISEILRILPAVNQAIRAGTLVTDVGSTKQQIVEEAAKHFHEDRFFLGAHPMAGAETKGIRSADALLFENAVYVLTPSQQLPVSLTQDFGELIEKIGAKVLFLSPTMHDTVAAAVSHLPQMLAVTLMNLAARHQDDSPHFIKLAAGGFRDMTRVASSPYETWRDIIATNTQEIARFIDEYISELRKMKQKLLEADLEEDFVKAARSRLSVPRDTKGFLRPQFDVIVPVEDKPGVIASISTVLADAQINIKDIEVLKVREGDAGTIRLAFETPDDRKKAQQLLSKIGYSSRLRN